MGQVTLYLDSETEAKMKMAAKAAGLSLSRWVGDLIQWKTASEWPVSVEQLAGVWEEFPTAEELRTAQGEDLPRELF